MRKAKAADGTVKDEPDARRENGVHVCSDGDFKPVKRARDTHKGNYGNIYIIGGCATMVGAPILSATAAHAAYMNGVGKVTVCVPSVNRVALASRIVMAMMKFVKSTADGFMAFDKTALDDIMSKADAIDIGMGMGADPELKKIIMYIAENFGGRLVIDADGLNAISGDYGFLKNSRADIILTPHLGEFRRLTGETASIEAAKRLALSVGGVVVMKSATTVITDGTDVRVNTSGTPAMAKGGTGDVLGGCIAGLVSTFSPMDSAVVACYRNGKGAEKAVSAYAELMLTPADILKYADYKEI